MVKKAKEKEESFSEAFPMFDMEEDEEETVEEFFFLWDSNLKIYNIFQLLLPFLGEYYALAPTSQLLIELAKEEGLKLSLAISHISYIHNGYASTVLKNKDKD